MSLVSLPITLANGTPNDATQVMADFNNVVGVINGNLDSTNINIGRGIGAAYITAGTFQPGFYTFQNSTAVGSPVLKVVGQSGLTANVAEMWTAGGDFAALGADGVFRTSKNPSFAGSTPITLTSLSASAPLSYNNSTGVFALVAPLSIGFGGNGSTTPGFNPGANILISGPWPNQTVSLASAPIISGAGIAAGSVPNAALATQPLDVSGSLQIKAGSLQVNSNLTVLGSLTGSGGIHGLWLITGTNSFIGTNGDIGAARDNDPRTGAIFLGSGGSHYLFFDAANYQLANAGLIVGGNISAGQITASGQLVAASNVIISSNGTQMQILPLNQTAGGYISNAANSVAIVVWDNVGNLTVSGSYFANSASALKSNIAPLSFDALAAVRSTEIVEFTYKADESERQHLGFLADVAPVEVSPDRERHDLNRSVAILWRAVQQLAEKVA